MQNITSLTSKGQVTIPKAIRDELGLRPFRQDSLHLEDGEVKLEKAYPSLGRRWQAVLPAPHGKSRY